MELLCGAEAVTSSDSEQPRVSSSPFVIPSFRWNEAFHSDKVKARKYEYIKIRVKMKVIKMRTGANTVEIIHSFFPPTINFSTVDIPL